MIVCTCSFHRRICCKLIQPEIESAMMTREGRTCADRSYPRHVGRQQREPQEWPCARHGGISVIHNQAIENVLVLWTEHPIAHAVSVLMGHGREGL